jgi:hypothetical protein
VIQENREYNDWKELRVFLMVVVVMALDVTPHSFAAGTNVSEKRLRFKDLNAFTSQKTAVVDVAELTHADTFDPVKGTEYGNPRVQCQRRLIRLDM